MPELPEVETIRRQLGPRLAGRRIVGATAHPSAKFAPATRAVGATVGDLRRRGKYLLADLDDDRELIVHLGMTGSLRCLPAGPRDDPYERAVWALDDGTELVFRDVRRFGRLAVVSAGDHRELPTLASLGPEPFDPALDDAAFASALRASSRAVKTQLLSQRPVAGVGNIYADEALWRAGVHPGDRRLTRPASAGLLAAVRSVLAAGIEHGGTTLRDYVDAEGRRGTNQLHLDCYGRAGEPCTRCGERLRSGTLDARTTTWCPRCQPPRAPRTLRVTIW